MEKKSFAPSWGDSKPANSSPSKPDRAGGGLVAAASLFLALALICVGYGWWRMYSYDDLTDKIVGGDAYNYQILTARGTGIITAGVALAVVAAVFAILAVGEKIDAR